jgi:hypothetical protein
VNCGDSERQSFIILLLKVRKKLEFVSETEFVLHYDAEKVTFNKHNQKLAISSSLLVTKNLEYVETVTAMQSS